MTLLTRTGALQAILFRIIFGHLTTLDVFTMTKSELMSLLTGG